jgi:hypothetical protein
MSIKKTKSFDYKTISSGSKEKVANRHDSLKPLKSPKREDEFIQSLKNLNPNVELVENTEEPKPDGSEIKDSEKTISEIEKFNQAPVAQIKREKQNKPQRKIEKDEQLLSRDRWFARNGHTLTYAGIFLFTLVVYFRPYDWIPGLTSFDSMALVVAVTTLLIYLPTQFSLEGSVTILPTEIKCMLFLAFWHS